MFKYRTVFAILPIPAWRLDADGVARRDGWFWFRRVTQHFTLWNDWVAWRDENPDEMTAAELGKRISRGERWRIGNKSSN